MVRSLLDEDMVVVSQPDIIVFQPVIACAAVALLLGVAPGVAIGAADYESLVVGNDALDNFMTQPFAIGTPDGFLTVNWVHI
jgi:hypothetical protein